MALALLHSSTGKTICTPSYSLSDSVPAAQHQYDRKVHLILPVNAGAARDELGAFCKTLFSALVHGYEPTIVNWDADGRGDWLFMQRLKVNGAVEYLENITDSKSDGDIALLADALDVWFQLSPKTLVERFDELGTSGVVASAEINCCCWPPIDRFWAISDDICSRIPNSTLPSGLYAADEEPRAINAGTVMGSVAAMRTIYKELADEMAKPERDKSETDQGLLNEFLVSGNWDISVDYRARLFWATAYSDPTNNSHFINTPYHIDNLIPHELYPPLLNHAITSEVPAMIHFNGPDKPLINEWWGKLWWQQLEGARGERFRDIAIGRAEAAVVNIVGVGPTKWRDLCPMDDIGF